MKIGLIDAEWLEELFPDTGEGEWTYNATALGYISVAPTIRTKQVKYYDDDEKVWKIGEVIANTLHDITDSYKGSEYNGNIKD